MADTNGGNLIDELDQKKTTGDRKLWDTFQSNPVIIKTGSVVEKKFYESILKILKLILYLVLLVINVLANFVSTGSELFAVAQVSGRSVDYCYYGNGNKYAAQLSVKAQAPWYWCLIVAFSVPEIVTFLRSPWMYGCIGCKIPKLHYFGVLGAVEFLHAIGLALLFFVVLPDLDVLQATTVFTCICLFPAILGLLSDFDGTEYDGPLGISYEVISDIVALSLQVIGIMVFTYIGFQMDDTLAPWLLPIALVITSIRWWGNYASNQCNFGFINIIGDYAKSVFLAERKYEENPAKRGILNGFRAVVRVLTFTTCAFLIALWKGMKTDEFFDGITINEPRFLFYERENPNNVNYDHADRWIPVYIAVLHIGSSFCVYICALFACKTRMQSTGFALPINLAIPTSFFGIFVLCNLRAKDPCAFQDFIPNHLFFITPKNTTWLLEWHEWIWPLWWVSMIWITRHAWLSSCERLATASRLFVTPIYDSLLVGHSLALARWRFEPEEYDNDETGGGISKSDFLTQIYACATMWHETPEEMAGFLLSILRLDKDREKMELKYKKTGKYPRDYYMLEVHIFFDDAFKCVKCGYSSCVHLENEACPDTEINDYAHDFIKTVEQCVTSEGFQYKPPAKIPTHYGGRLQFTLPKGTLMNVHLKDKNRIRAKKRWSQVMYLYYLLGYKFMDENTDIVDRKEARSDRTFILTLDGDIDFQPKAVKVLIDRMKVNKRLGSVCGRIHPLGNGPLVWYQKFEYAVGHWLQKATEHVTGSVLCSPGCFALFRAKALMEDDAGGVINRYATIPKEAQEFIQYDQGEDRWLCTLLLQQGWKVEYSAASDSYTHAPESFNAFFIQRRRWIPSTVANILDLLDTSEFTIKKNPNISRLYIWYQKLLMISTILGPGTIFLMLVGSFAAVFGIGNWNSFVYNLVPILIFCIVCYTCKEKTQLMLAAVLSATYGLVMVVVLVGALLQISEDGWLAPTTLLFAIFVGEYIVTGLLHPLEFDCLVCGIIYYVTVPSMYLILIIFSLFNMNNISWGTREAPKPPDMTPEVNANEVAITSTNVEEKKDGKVTKFFKSLLGIKELSESLNRIERKLDRDNLSSAAKDKPDKIDAVRRRQSMKRSRIDIANSCDDDQSGSNEDAPEVELKNFLTNPYWLTKGEKKLGTGHVEFLSDNEKDFWASLIKKYLEPIDKDVKKEQKNKEALLELRNQYAFKFFMINALFVLSIFLMQKNKDILHIVWPLDAKYSIEYYKDTETVVVNKKYLKLEPIGCLFIFGFIIILFIQFVAMLVHRFETFSHIISQVDVKALFKKQEKFEPEPELRPGNNTKPRMAMSMDNVCEVPPSTNTHTSSFRHRNMTMGPNNQGSIRADGNPQKIHPNIQELERNNDYAFVDDLHQLPQRSRPKYGQDNDGYDSEDEAY